MKKLLLLAVLCISSSSNAVPAQTATDSLKSESWYESELAEKHIILRAFWKERILKLNQESVNKFKEHLVDKHFPEDPAWQKEIDKLFSDAIAHKIGFDTFFNGLKDLPLVLFNDMNKFEKLTKPAPKGIEKVNPDIKPSDLAHLKKYMQDKGLSASITLGSADGTLITPDFTGNKSSPYAIHSIGKVFTGMLAILMIRDGIISEDDLNVVPVQLDASVKKALPVAVREQLKKVTLHQLMIHKAGLGNYLGAYLKAISEGKNPKMKTPEDFLQFAEDKVFPVGEEKYSNLGILLVGLALQHAYEKNYGPCAYNNILQKYIINEVGMPSFTVWKPENGKFNHADPKAAYIAGSPAGGYWMTTEDLAKFGQWIYRKTKADPKLETLMKKYGQEFYRAEDRVVSHGGAIDSSSAFFSVSLKTGAIIAILSDQPDTAFELKWMLRKKIFSEPQKVR
jgi:hypothetical protein